MSDNNAVSVNKKYWMPWHNITVPLSNEVWLKPLTKEVVDSRARNALALNVACGFMAFSFFVHVTWFALVPGLICAFYVYQMFGGDALKTSSEYVRARNWIAHKPTYRAMLYSYIKPHELQWLEDYEKPEVLAILKSLSVQQGFLIKGQVLAARLQVKKDSINRTKIDWGQL